MFTWLAQKRTMGWPVSLHVYVQVESRAALFNTYPATGYRLRSCDRVCIQPVDGDVSTQLRRSEITIGS
jgi:hypothetical protein